MTDVDLLHRLEAFYDAVPRAHARAESFGPLVLFVREGVGWPFYARPVSPSVVVTPDDVSAARTRQRELQVPEQFEWVHELTPSLTDASRLAGLEVERCPLLVLDVSTPPDPASFLPPGYEAAMVGPDAADLAAVEAVANVGFASRGTCVGQPGAAERDAAAAAGDPQRLEGLRHQLRSGGQARAVVRGPQGPVGVGGYQSVGEVAEVVGVATLPSMRRQGIAAAVTALLVRDALDRGRTTVFLGAQDDDVARVYERVGFRRVGTAGIAQPATP